MAISFSLECVVASCCHLIYKLESISWLNKIIMRLVIRILLLCIWQCSMRIQLIHSAAMEEVFLGILVTSEIL